MQQKLSIRVSDRITLTLESADMRELVRTGSFWSELPSQCPICQAGVQLMYRNPQDNEYFGMQCTGPTKHETNFGIYKESSKGLYYKREWHVAFQGGGGPQAYGDQNQYSGAPQQPQQYPAQYSGAPQGQAPQGGQPDYRATQAQVNKIIADAQAIGLNPETLAQELTGKPIHGLEKRDASKIIDHLMSKRDEYNQFNQAPPQGQPAAPPSLLAQNVGGQATAGEYIPAPAPVQSSVVPASPSTFAPLGPNDDIPF